jgi:hypothetical protein
VRSVELPCYLETQGLGALLASFRLAGNSLTGQDRGKLSWQEKEEQRKASFQKRPLLDTVPKLPGEEGSAP